MKFSLNKPVIYVARDLERTLGLPVTTKGYYIISNYTAFANSLAKGRKNVLLIKNTELLDTRELLVHAKTINFIKKIKNPQVLVFKNTLAIEKICQENGWTLLNPSAGLASEVEEKITQVQWLGNLKKYLPPAVNIFLDFPTIAPALFFLLLLKLALHLDLIMTTHFPGKFFQWLKYF